jgi:geranylgeranyl reductase
MTSIYDALVVGGGISGSIAAKILAGGGAKVLLVEKDFTRVKPCGGATPYKSFEEFSLPLQEIIRKVEHVSSVSPSGVKVEVALKGGYLAMVERGKFDHALRKQAEDAGADLAEAEFRTMEERQKKIFVTLNEQGSRREVTADFLIAADGVNSRVARSAGFSSLPGVYTIQEDVDPGAVDTAQRPETCEFWFGLSHAPGFYSWVFPKDGYIDIGTASVNGKSLKVLMENFKKRLRIEGIGRQKIYRLPLTWRDSLVSNNILFIGDAAGLVMPLTYEGMYYAMKSGQMAAEAILKGSPKAYEKKWNRTFRSQFKLMKRLAKFFLKNDRSIEKTFSIHKNRYVQETALKLMLEKDLSLSSFLGYKNVFIRFLQES